MPHRPRERSFPVFECGLPQMGNKEAFRFDDFSILEEVVVGLCPELVGLGEYENPDEEREFRELIFP